MDAISRIRRVVDSIRSGPVIRHGHVYTDTITGERFEVITVGRWVEIERFDADRRPDNTVRKGQMEDALTVGAVEHVTKTCPACSEDSGV